MVRTTIDLEEELLRTAKAIAEVRRQTLSAVISELAWRGLRADTGEDVHTRNGFPVLAARSGSQPVTPEHVAQLLEQDDGDEARIEARD
jgi:hypothetical protein